MKRNELRDLRKSRGWTQQELADGVGLSREYVGQLERGDANISLTIECAVRWACREDRDTPETLLRKLGRLMKWGA